MLIKQKIKLVRDINFSSEKEGRNDLKVLFKFLNLYKFLLIISSLKINLSDLSSNRNQTTIQTGKMFRLLP